MHRAVTFACTGQMACVPNDGRVSLIDAGAPVPSSLTHNIWKAPTQRKFGAEKIRQAPGR